MAGRIELAVRDYIRTGVWSASSWHKYLVPDVPTDNEPQQPQVIINITDDPEAVELARQRVRERSAIVAQYHEELKSQDPLFEWVNSYIDMLFQEAFWIYTTHQFPNGKPYLKQNPYKIRLWQMLLPVVNGMNQGYSPKQK